MIRFDQVHKRYRQRTRGARRRLVQYRERRADFFDRPFGGGQEQHSQIDCAHRAPHSRPGHRQQPEHRGREAARHSAFSPQIGVVFQDHKLLHDRPVADNVALPLVIAGVPRREIDKRVRAALDQVGLLGKEKSLPLGTLDRRAAARGHRAGGGREAGAAHCR